MSYTQIYNLITMKKPPRSKSSQSLRFTKNTEVVELVSEIRKIEPESVTEKKDPCKYCLLKQKFGSQEKAKCLAHSYQTDSIQETVTIQAPETPPLKPKKQPYDRDNFTLSSTELELVVLKLTTLSKQLYSTLQKINKTIHWEDHSQLLTTLTSCFKYLPEDSRTLNKSMSSESPITNNQSSLQFQLSSYDQPFQQSSPDYSFKNILCCLLHEARQSTYIRSEIVTSFIYQIQSKLKQSQESLKHYHFKIGQYQQKISDLTKKCHQKISTDHTIKQFEQDFNFIERFSELADMSIKDMCQQCIICKYKVELSQINQDMFHYLLLQAHSLETVIANT